MFIRNKFITNSSSTGFVAWGIIVDAWTKYLPDCEDHPLISVHHAPDNKRVICIDKSMSYSSSEDDEGDYIDQGIYVVDESEDKLIARCIATIPFRKVKPPFDDYSEWEKAILAFCKEQKIENYLRYTPGWRYVRYHS